jgi:molybdenum cofactor cytidylyltransferase
VIAAAVLAAGGSARLGAPKQLVVHRGRSLVRRAAVAALDGGCRPVLVVVGAAAREVAAEVEGLEVAAVTNRDWREGLASSIRCAIDRLSRLDNAPRGVVLMGCDQPHLTAAVVRRLLAAGREEEGAGIVACEYGGSLGTPALFPARIWPRLRQLTGDRGAKQLILEAREEVRRIPWPEGAADVDRPEDLDPLRRR